jgi:hypothetical protein
VRAQYLPKKFGGEAEPVLIQDAYAAVLQQRAAVAEPPVVVTDGPEAEAMAAVPSTDSLDRAAQQALEIEQLEAQVGLKLVF